MTYNNPIVIEETLCSYKGQFDIALELFVLVKKCSFFITKTQKINNTSLLIKDQHGPLNFFYYNPYEYIYDESNFTACKGSDYIEYLEAKDLGKLNKDNALYQSLTFKNDKILEIEKVQRENLNLGLNK
tara:strand:+ start:661 stop:1047 length:387 start_codon:yes stop_codon:yes gene_type:complete